MTRYVDGFLLPVPKKKLDAYRRMSRLAGKVWRAHGALEYVECVGDDLKVKGHPSFAKRSGAKAGDTVLFSWIIYRSRAHRDLVNARVMKDPRLVGMIEMMEDPKKRPFDLRKMSFGGFKVLVDV